MTTINCYLRDWGWRGSCVYRNSFCITQQITVTTCHANTWKTWSWLFSTQVMRIWKLPGPLQPSKSWAVAVAARFMSSQSSQPLILPGSQHAVCHLQPTGRQACACALCAEETQCLQGSGVCYPYWQTAFRLCFFHAWSAFLSVLMILKDKALSVGDDGTETGRNFPELL